MELQGLKTVEGKEPPRLLRINPRLRGDFGGKAMIELNTYSLVHWGSTAI